MLSFRDLYLKSCRFETKFAYSVAQAEEAGEAPQGQWDSKIIISLGVIKRAEGRARAVRRDNRCSCPLLLVAGRLLEN